VYAGQAAHGLGEVPVRAGIVLSPERDALMPFGVASAITIERSRGKHEAGKNELGALLPIGREFEGEVLDSIELTERPLKGEQRTQAQQTACRPAQCLQKVHPSPLDRAYHCRGGARGEITEEGSDRANYNSSSKQTATLPHLPEAIRV
jgi:hypothetical protein